MSINSLVKDLKENNQDFEFYPTTDQMLDVISPFLEYETVLDIGCGTCKFKHYLINKYTKRFNELKKLLDENRGNEKFNDYYDEYYRLHNPIETYYVFEKSQKLIDMLDEDTICLGTDFNNNSLIDKKVSTIFCNPPYSQFESWTTRILTEGNFKQAFLVIPVRWKDNPQINAILDFQKINYEILGEFDFLNAERKARAKVNVVRFVKTKNKYQQNNFDDGAFDDFFKKTFNVETKTIENKSNTNTYLVTALENSKKSKVETLLEMYDNEYNTLIKNLNLIMQLDSNVLETFGFSIEKVKEGLKLQISGMKDRYWNTLLNELEEITSKLTYESRHNLMQSFIMVKTLDFTYDNIITFVKWVLKNSNKFYKEQLITLFKKLSDKQNVKPFKSNTKLFDDDNWRWNSDKKDNYVLDYRLIMGYVFRVSWSGNLEKEYSSTTFSDIWTIANNLGFETNLNDWNRTPDYFGQEMHIYSKNNELFATYRAYKNGNVHIKFNKEFTKAFNVEVSRLLGWIRCKEDIKKEFPDDLAKNAEKYFNSNLSLDFNQTLLLLK